MIFFSLNNIFAFHLLKFEGLLALLLLVFFFRPISRILFNLKTAFLHIVLYHGIIWILNFRVCIFANLKIAIVITFQLSLSLPTRVNYRSFSNLFNVFFLVFFASDNF